MSKIADLRKSYSRGSLSESDVNPNPIEQFRHWFEQARQAECPEPNAMTVASASPQGIPSARVVLLKDVDDRGFIFFTNYESHKGRELIANPHAALLFHWHELERQVRIEGQVEKLPEEESNQYYESRPLDSRIGAWASPQSQVISGRTYLVAKAAEFGLKFGLNPPRPPHWGGFLVRPAKIEFWQGRPSRLHDRIQFTRNASEASGWEVDRLAP
jgi:pyridoxamine 5'-phosphate oxidase